MELGEHMPTARIITSMPEFSGGLVRDLNSRGFEVQILSPEQAISGKADLEIKLEVVASLSETAKAPAPVPTRAPEDVWTMLAAFDSDSKTPDTAAIELSKPSDTISPAQTSTAMQPPVEYPGNSIHATEAAPSTFPETDSANVDSELVPSMFSLSADQNGSSTGKVANPHGRSSNFFRLKLENKFWDVRSTKITTAVACTAMVLLAIVSLVHRRAPLPADTNSAAQPQTSLPFHPAAAPAATSSTVPVKTVALSNAPISTKPHAGIRSEADRNEIAKDTIIRFTDTAKQHASKTTKKENGIRYYSDME